MEAVTTATLDSRRSWFMWGLATSAYVVAVTHRTTFGVAGVIAGERFASGASLVSLFIVVQLLTYASMQVPVGVLADRFGTRVMLGTGAALMALGQLGLAFADNLVSAMIARVLVGAGDAMTFTPFLRLLPAWFSARRLPVLNQLIGMTGQIGQLLSALPFAALLRTRGWTPAFASAAAMGAIVGVVVVALLRDHPDGRRPPVAPQESGTLHQLGLIVREPGTRLAFWIHWMCASWGMLFAFMWGYPFLTQGQGLSPEVASGFVSLYAVAAMLSGPLVGLLSRRAPLQRSNLAFVLTAGAAVPWAAVLLWPGPSPLWLLALLVIGIASSGPGSAIGFDVARSVTPGHRIGTASGFVIVAGFMAGLINIWVVGLVLDVLGGYTLGNFRWALSTQYVFLVIGVVGALTSRAAARRVGRSQGVRYQSLYTVLSREWRYWMRQWRDFFTGTTTTPARPEAELDLPAADGSVVSVVALVPADGGGLTAIDVPPADADTAWWDVRVGEYLALVAHPNTVVTGIEIRCPDAVEAASARREIADILAARGASLVAEVTVTHS